MSATGGHSQLQRQKKGGLILLGWPCAGGMSTDLQPWIKAASHAKNNRGLGTSCSPGTILVTEVCPAKGCSPEQHKCRVNNIGHRTWPEHQQSTDQWLWLLAYQHHWCLTDAGSTPRICCLWANGNSCPQATFRLENRCIVAPWKADADKISDIKL